MKRIKFRKGFQRKFMLKVLENTNTPSLRELRKRGFDVNYSTLKNYLNEDRTLPLELFKQLCEFSKLNKEEIKYEILDENWGQIKGGTQKYLNR